MSLNKQKGNMYPFVTHTWNPIRGRCPHQCSYCYMRSFKIGELRLDGKCLSDDLSRAQTIFVGSSTDMWAEAVPKEWINKVLTHCRKFPMITFLFQSKNPARFADVFADFIFPPSTILGTTLESNRNYIGISEAPKMISRVMGLASESWHGYRKMIAIEPVMDFDLSKFVVWIKAIAPEFVSIGADSKGHSLPEPDGHKLIALIQALEQFTKVKQKGNLQRLVPHVGKKAAGHLLDGKEWREWPQ